MRSSKGAAIHGTRTLLLDTLQLVLEQSPLTKAHSKKLRYARGRGYVQKTVAGYSITPKGKAMLSERQIWELEIPIPKRWDGMWHLILFDIPKDKRKRRDIFRLRLKELGFTLYQNSVWVHPHPCEQVVQQVAEFYHLSKCVSFIEASEISGEDSLIKRYEL
ncbi:MAG TPA: CRISPR-associated endonuclease Cas2 [Candidatus Paceibacterota bacterium]|nr:CRISPR-associated endonuclease Cas2 [Candidatus Paceibacterota bacterium]